MNAVLEVFPRIVFLDFEFTVAPGGRPVPICLVWKRYGEDAVHRVWLHGVDRPPMPDFGDDALFVAYFASAEWSCFLELGWGLPRHVLDLHPEFRCLTNGALARIGGGRQRAGLLDALIYFGLAAMDAVEKQEMRALAIRGGPYTLGEKKALIEYCEEDVRALERLIECMADLIDLPRALLRGRYTKAVALMECAGVPVDGRLLAKLERQWTPIREGLIRAVDASFGVFDGMSFRASKWLIWTHAHGIPWPRLESGAPALDDDTFKAMALAHPVVEPMRELRKVLSQLRKLGITVGPDGRNRCMLSPYGTMTGRNSPSNSKFIFGAPGWLRGVIRPGPGRANAYIDWSQQEFGTAAALSGDGAMIAAYESAEPYLALAKQAGAAPPHATKESHPVVREQFKACVLGTQYGMSEFGLAQRIGQSTVHARALLDAHYNTYRGFWAWSEGMCDAAFLTGRMRTVFGWTLHITKETRRRTVANFPMQGNGAEMMRLAACLATERGVTVCAPVHDAFLVEAGADEIEDAVAATRRAMAEASAAVLGGFELRTDAEIIRHPDRFLGDRGRVMWDRVMDILLEIEEDADEPVSAGHLAEAVPDHG